MALTIAIYLVLAVLIVLAVSILGETVNFKIKINPALLFQHVMAYAAVVFGVLTTQLQGIKLPMAASVILGVFGVLLHPWTSITQTTHALPPGPNVPPTP